MLKGEKMHADVNASQRRVKFAFSLWLICVRNLLSRFSSPSSSDTNTLIVLFMRRVCVCVLYYYFLSYVRIHVVVPPSHSEYRHTRLLSFLLEPIFVKPAHFKQATSV